MVDEDLGRVACSPPSLFEAAPQGPLYGSVSSQLGSPPERRHGILARLLRPLGGRRRSSGHLDTQSMCSAAGRRGGLGGLLRGLRASRGSLQEPALGTTAWTSLFKSRPQPEQAVEEMEEVVKMETDFRNVSLSPDGGEGRGRKASLRPSLSLVWQEIAPPTPSTPPTSHQARRLTMDDSGFSEAEAVEGQPFGPVELTEEVFQDMFAPSTSSTTSTSSAPSTTSTSSAPSTTSTSSAPSTTSTSSAPSTTSTSSAPSTTSSPSTNSASSNTSTPSTSTTPSAASSTCPSTCPATNSSHLASTSSYLSLPPTTATRTTVSPTPSTTSSTPVPSACLTLSPTTTSSSTPVPSTSASTPAPSTSTGVSLRSRLATNLFHLRRGARP